MRNSWISVLICLGILFSTAGVVSADGIVIPEIPPCPPDQCPSPRPMTQLVIRYHHVTVTIKDQLAITHVDQVFYNPNDWIVEGTYIFPLPLDAVVSNFTLWVDGKPVEGVVLTADQARQTYQEIVNSMRDPALLEYIGRGAVQASIFPIPPEGERRIELEYQQVLTADHGLIQYTYPLNTEKYSLEPLEEVSITIEANSMVPVRAVYSPSHAISISREDDYRFSASYEAVNVLPDQDFSLYYSVGETEAFHLFTFRDPEDVQEKDGFFLLLLAPGMQGETAPVAKDVLLVLDQSGSMEGEKFQQAQAAARFILTHLNSEDRFYLASFSDHLKRFSPELSPASNAGEAVRWVDTLAAMGSTDIHQALLDTLAVADSERVTYLIFMTDGLPTAGEIRSEKILADVALSTKKNLRLFTFGVGYDVDTYLLDSLSGEHHGLSSYVRPGEPLDEILSAFYAKISTPVLTNLALDFGGLTTYDVFPNPLPDFFVGSQVVVVGRYVLGGEYDVTLTGQVNGKQQTFIFPDQQFTNRSVGRVGTGAMLPRLWATRKVGYLLNQIRLSGVNQELVDQVVRLSIRYGIVTPYTSYLVTEPAALGAENLNRLAQDAYSQMLAQPTLVSGMGAVEKAVEEGALSQANAAPEVPAGQEGSLIRIVGARTFVLQDGIWTDTAYDPDRDELIRVGFLSTDYYKLAGSREDIAAAFALGQSVILMLDGKAYQVVAEGEPTHAIQLPVISGGDSSTITPKPALTDPIPQSTPVPPSDPVKPPAGICGWAFLPLGLILLLVKKQHPREDLES